MSLKTALAKLGNTKEEAIAYLSRFPNESRPAGEFTWTTRRSITCPVAQFFIEEGLMPKDGGITGGVYGVVPLASLSEDINGFDIETNLIVPLVYHFDSALSVKLNAAKINASKEST